MPSTIRESLDREIAVRGGVTLGLGPQMVQTYGASDLRKEVSRRIKEALGASNGDMLREALLIDVSVGGIVTKRELSLVVPDAACADLVVRSAVARDTSGAKLTELAKIEDASETLKQEAGRFASDPAGYLESMEPLPDLFVPPRITVATPAKKNRVGRNDPCPCGSGKKFKKCHVSMEGLGGAADAPGTPGLTPSEVFWFRDLAVELGKLCHRRLAEGGPRAGETLFWPVAYAPEDELEIRVETAIATGKDLLDVLERGWKLGFWREDDVGSVLLRAFPPAGWFTGDFLNWLRALPADRCAQLALFGGWTGAEVLELRKAKAGPLNAVITDLAQSDQVLADACALALAGQDSLAFVALQVFRGTGESPNRDEITLYNELESVLAPRVGRPVLGCRQFRGAASPANRQDLDALDKLVTDLKEEVTRERDLRQQVQSAWTPDEPTGQEESLRAQLRRLQDELKVERHASREALRDVQRFRQRERVRLIRESHLEADVVAALVDEADPEEVVEKGRPRDIQYSDDFEVSASRVPPSTLVRLREQVAAFARGTRVREAKRMEALDDVWTLRAGIHHRVILRATPDRIEVLNLIPREELENVLNRMRG